MQDNGQKSAGGLGSKMTAFDGIKPDLHRSYFWIAENLHILETDYIARRV